LRNIPKRAGSPALAITEEINTILESGWQTPFCRNALIKEKPDDTFVDIIFPND